MGREVRKVPADWQHPKDETTRRGNGYKPMHEGQRYETDKTAWEEKFAAEGMQAAIDWCGNPPNVNDYMPNWPDTERTHFMMYEDTTEGTPISPAFATPQELARWLADNKASAFGGMTATYEQWLAMIDDGSSVSMVMETGRMMSGVEFAAKGK